MAAAVGRARRVGDQRDRAALSVTGGDPQTALTTAAQQADDLISNYNLTNGG